MKNQFSWVRVGGCLAALVIGGQLLPLLNNIANAQVSEVPNFNSSGDFETAILPGNRGFYQSNYWVVAPQQDTGTLNCRYTPNGEVRSRIAEGAIINSKFTGPASLDNGLTRNSAADAIVFHNGKPWLRIVGTGNALVFPPGGGSEDYQGECYVRANSQYVIPVSNDAQLGSQPEPAAE